MIEYLAKQIHELVEPLAVEEGYEIFKVNINSYNKNVTVDLIIDKPYGGINLGQCSQFNRKVNALIEQNQLIESDYVVQVSSPGIDWPLKEKKDFIRATNHEVTIYLKEQIDGKLQYEGVVQDASVDSVTIMANGKSVLIPLNKINKGIEKI